MTSPITQAHAQSRQPARSVHQQASFARRSRSGRLLLQVAALLSLVAGLSLGFVLLRSPRQELGSAAGSAADPRPVDTRMAADADLRARPRAGELAATPSSNAARSFPAAPTREAESTLFAARAETETAALPAATAGGGAGDGAGGGSIGSDPGAAVALRSRVTESVARPAAESLRREPSGRTSPTPPAATSGIPLSVLAATSGSTAARDSRAASPDLPASAEDSAPSPSPQAAPHAKSRSEIIESSKRLHELRLEALRASGQLPPDS